tara:strand:- start:4368 stop:4967 length:600 start_codon:yes stop_codon:yes gene_type:complete
MLYVNPQPEPADFDAKVRQKGLSHLRNNVLGLANPLPKGVKIPAYWQDCLDELYHSYGGVCAYLAIHFERIIGGGSVDHFAAKSALPGQAYEWGNYRLACSRMNSRKNRYSDVLDPFEVEDGWFRLEVVSGRLYPNPDLEPATLRAVKATITRLKLDDQGCREVRARHFSDYTQKMYTAEFLRLRSPFVWFEANRQGLL